MLFILADTLRADQVTRSRNGTPLMPNLAAFAAESWNYRNARVQSTWTKPSMTSIFTSLYPDVHNVLYGIDGDISGDELPKTNVLPEALETIAEFFKANAYSTAAVQTNANITSHFGFAQGFDTFEVKRYPKFHARDVTDLAISTLPALKPPFFFYAHYMDPHAPYEAPEEYVAQVGPLPELSDEDKALLQDYSATYRDRVLFEVGLTEKRQFGNLSEKGEDYIRAKYDASCRYLDAELGRFIGHVRERYPNTIIVFTADHGEELWEHGSIGHGKTVYEELTRVPLIIRVPGAPARVIDAPVETIDILPTIAALAGFSLRPEWQGRDITQSDLPSDRPVFSSTKMSMSGSNRDLDAVTVGDRKLIVDHIAGKKTIYELRDDPGEMHGTELAPSEKSDLMALLDGFHAQNAQHPRRQVDRESAGLTSEQEENIRALGYLD